MQLYCINQINIFCKYEKCVVFSGNNEIAKENLESSNAEDIDRTFNKIIVPKKRKTNDSGGTPKKKKRTNNIDLENYIPYKPADSHTEQG